MLRADVVSTSLSARLREATERLARAGIASPRADAERLAADALGTSWGDLWHRFDATPGSRELRQLESLVERRASGEPLAYITGSVVFYGREFQCGPGVLVPRPETETLVDVALELVDSNGSIVVDIGTGSGAVAVSIAAERPRAGVWATDVSGEARAYAIRNARSHRVRLEFAGGDLFEELPSTLRGRVDLVVSNPPYVASDTELPPDVRAEPRVALDGGPEGLDVLLRLVDEAPVWLSPHGSLALEVGTSAQADRVLAELRSWHSCGVRPDHTRRPRVVWAQRGSGGVAARGRCDPPV